MVCRTALDHRASLGDSLARATRAARLSQSCPTEPRACAAQLSRSAVLGEMVLLYQDKRTATVTAMCESSVLSLSREAYQLMQMDTCAIRCACASLHSARRLPCTCTCARYSYDLGP